MSLIEFEPTKKKGKIILETTVNWDIVVECVNEWTTKVIAGHSFMIRINKVASLRFSVPLEQSSINERFDIGKGLPLTITLENNCDSDGKKFIKEINVEFCIGTDKSGYVNKNIPLGKLKHLPDHIIKNKVVLLNEAINAIVVKDEFVKTTNFVGGDYEKVCHLWIDVKLSIPQNDAEDKEDDYGDLFKTENEGMNLVAKAVEEVDFSKHLGCLFYSAENYADLTLISADGMEHGAHRFLVAARSPRFQRLLQEKNKENDWDGKTVKLDDVHAKPLVAMIHWIYTGKLHEEADKCLKALFHCAIKYELKGLLDILDEKLITISKDLTNVEVVQLFELAKENDMPTAVTQLSQLIMRNVQRDVQSWSRQSSLKNRNKAS